MATNALGFKEWANSESVSQSGSLDQLKDRRIGIDGDDYVNTLLFTNQQEPLLTALGGLPFSLHERVDNDLQNFQDAGIEPVFVFNGLDLACKDKASIIKESRKAESTLKQAWTIYDEGHGEQAVKAFGKLCKYCELNPNLIVGAHILQLCTEASILFETYRSICGIKEPTLKLHLTPQPRSLCTWNVKASLSLCLDPHRAYSSVLKE